MLHGDTTHVVVVGDAMLDIDEHGNVERLVPGSSASVLRLNSRLLRPGGAGLAAVLGVADCTSLTLVTALADDERGQLVGDLARRDGVTVIDLGRQGTTAERRRVFDGARLILRVDDGLPGIVGAITSRARAALQTADAVLVADYGQGVAAEPSVREALMSCVAPLVWDPHPLGAAVLAGATVVTPNEREAALPGSATTEAALTIGAALARRYGALSACITRGARGAVLAFAEGGGVELPAKSIHDGDDCGAGDRLAVAIAGALARGASVEKAARHAIAAAGRFVATGAC